MKKVDKDMPYANQKLLELIDIHADGRVQKFAKMVGLSQQRINRLFNRDSRNGQYPRMTEEIKTAIVNHFGLDGRFFVMPPTEEEVNPYELFSGADNITDFKETRKEIQPSRSFNPNVGVPYFNVDFEMGFDLMVNDQTTTPSYMINFHPYNKCTCWCNARGNSMHPTISSGDIIALRKIEDFRFLISGEIYAIVTQNELRTIKRVKDNGDTMTLIPDNKDYPEQTINKNDVLHVYQVMGSMKMF